MTNVVQSLARFTLLMFCKEIHLFLCILTGLRLSFTDPLPNSSSDSISDTVVRVTVVRVTVLRVTLGTEVTVAVMAVKVVTLLIVTVTVLTVILQ